MNVGWKESWEIETKGVFLGVILGEFFFKFPFSFGLLQHHF